MIRMSSCDWEDDNETQKLSFSVISLMDMTRSDVLSDVVPKSKRGIPD